MRVFLVPVKYTLVCHAPALAVLTHYCVSAAFLCIFKFLLLQINLRNIQFVKHRNVSKTKALVSSQPDVPARLIDCHRDPWKCHPHCNSPYLPEADCIATQQSVATTQSHLVYHHLSLTHLYLHLCRHLSHSYM